MIPAIARAKDAGLVAFYLGALSLGVLHRWHARGGNVDIMRVLFGTVLASIEWVGAGQPWIAAWSCYRRPVSALGALALMDPRVPCAL